MYHVSAQGVDERMINVHYYYLWLLALLWMCVCGGGGVNVSLASRLRHITCATPAGRKALWIIHEDWQDCLHPHKNVETSEFLLRFFSFFFLFLNSILLSPRQSTAMYRMTSQLYSGRLFLLENMHTKKTKHPLFFDLRIRLVWTYFKSYASSVIKNGTTRLLLHGTSFSRVGLGILCPIL